MAAEALRELRGLVVAHTCGDRAHGDPVGRQQRAGVVHADLGELVAEARVAHLGERPLKLPAGGRQLACDAFELQVTRVVAGDEGNRLVVKLFAALRGSVSHGHGWWRPPKGSGVSVPVHTDEATVLGHIRAKTNPGGAKRLTPGGPWWGGAPKPGRSAGLTTARRDCPVSRPAARPERGRSPA